MDLTREQLAAVQPWLEARGGIEACRAKPIYRGISGTLKDGVGRTHAYRQPRGMPLAWHHRIDQWFRDRHGHGFRSRNVMFCTGDREDAGQWGDLYEVLPIGEFRYAWSPAVRDLTNHVDAQLDALAARMRGEEASAEEIEWREVLGESPDADRYPDLRELREAAITLAEEMLNGFEGAQGYRCDGLEEAIASGCEIMVVCEWYLAIPASSA